MITMLVEYNTFDLYFFNFKYITENRFYRMLYEITFRSASKSPCNINYKFSSSLIFHKGVY